MEKTKKKMSPERHERYKAYQRSYHRRARKQEKEPVVEEAIEAPKKRDQQRSLPSDARTDVKNMLARYGLRINSHGELCEIKSGY